jgi:hypothetical protein
LAQIFAGRFVFSKAGMMAEINKLSVEKTLNKLRANDAKQSKEAMLNDKSNVLDEEIGRMRAQRLRLERHQGKHHQERHAVHTEATEDRAATPTPPARYGRLGIALILVFALISLWLLGNMSLK